MTIKIGRNNQEIGDFPEEQIPELLRTKVVLPTDLFWHEGLPEWKAVASRWPNTAAGAATVSAMLDEPNSDEAETKKFSLATRGVGLLLLLGGGILSWLCVWDPLQEAANHENRVSLSFKGVLLAPLLVGLGLIYTIVPRLAVRFIGTPKQKSPGKWVVAIPLLIAGGVLYWALKKKLEEMGYAF